MALPVYSVQLDARTMTSGEEVTLTAPVGKQWIMRDIDLVNNTGTDKINLYVGPGPGSYVLIVTVGGGEAYSTSSWRGRQVIPAGQNLVVLNVEGTPSYAISGYQLSPPS